MNTNIRGKRRRLATGHRWGDWFLNAERLLLEYRPNTDEYLDIEAGCEYYIPLQELMSWSGYDRWLAQLRSKTWVTPKLLSDFTAAFDAIFEPEKNLTDWGGMSRSELERRLFRLDKETAAMRHEYAEHVYEEKIAREEDEG
jgi:hypothetical protein